MLAYLKISLSLALTIHPSFHVTVLEPTTDCQVKDFEFISLVCYEVVKRSKQNHLLVVDVNSKCSFDSLLNDFHNRSISVSLVKHQSNLETYPRNVRPENLLILLNDIDDILNFILNSVSHNQIRYPQNIQSNALPRLFHTVTGDDDHDLQKTFLNVDGAQGNQVRLRNLSETCDVIINITNEDVEDHSILSPFVFNRARSLYANKIWNSENFIIFKVSNFISVLKLSFTLKFFWRFFKGRRAIICSEQKCFKYDSFTGEILDYNRGSPDEFFNFMWKTMNKKQFLGYSKPDTFEVFSQLPTNVGMYQAILSIAMQYTVEAMNGSECFMSNSLYEELQFKFGDNDRGLQNGVDLYVMMHDVRTQRMDYSKYDYTIAIQSDSLCFIIPQTAYMPQYLVPFLCFSPATWTCCIVTFSALLFSQYFIDWFVARIFKTQSLAADTIKETSTPVTIYLYFYPLAWFKSHTDELFPRKILFITCSFSVIVVSSVFQSEMFNLLHKRLRYADIDTLEEMSGSEYLIQSANLSLDLEFFSDDSRLFSLKDKLIDSYYFNFMLIGTAADPLGEIPTYFWGALNKTLAIMRSCHNRDAFLVAVSQIFKSKRKQFFPASLRPTNPGVEKGHRYVQECVLTYPVIFYVSKSSLFFDKFNSKLSQLMEAGLIDYIMEQKQFMEQVFRVASDVRTTPRPFSLTDVHIAFIVLIFGLMLASIFFIAEHFFQELMSCKKLKKPVGRKT